MYQYERSYRTGRSVAAVLEAVSWVLVFVGLIAALLGFASGGGIGGASQSLASSDFPVLLRVVATLPGFLISSIGLFFILQCQQAKATLDSAEMTRDILQTIKGEDTIVPVIAAKPNARRIRLSDYKKRKLFSVGDKVILDDIYESDPREFNSLDEAKAFIDNEIRLDSEDR